MLAREPQLIGLIHATRALALESTGRVAEALAAAREAIAVAPDCVEAHCVYGNILGRSGAWASAWDELEFHWLAERAHFRRRFGMPEWNGEDLRGKRLLVVHGQGLGDLIQMARYLPHLRERAAQVAVEVPPSLERLLREVPGIVVARRGSVARDAFDVFARAMTLPRLLGEREGDARRPPRPGAYERAVVAFGVSAPITLAIDYAAIAKFCTEKGEFDLALQACARGLEQNPRSPWMHLRLAQTYDALADFERALDACASALALSPPPDAQALVLATRALALEGVGRIGEALTDAQLAIAASPERLEPHFAYGSILARGGDYAPAWRELEFHWLEERGWFRRRFGTPEWNGEDLDGRRLLVVHGQGIGDLVQMLRYVPRLRGRAADVVVEVIPSLLPLVPALPGITIARRDTVVWGPDDVFARAMALPRIFEESGTSEPPAPYLEVPRERAERWRARLGPRDGRLRVGLVWAGNPFHSRDRSRSIPLGAFAPLAAVAGVRWISLQYGPRALDVAPEGLQLERYADEIGDVADTAAIIAQCDVVIAVDTAVAHVAGAIGAPVWLLLEARPEWRWRRDAERTPWYANTQLVHADPSGWAPAIERVAGMLANRISHGAEVTAPNPGKA